MTLLCRGKYIFDLIETSPIKGEKTQFRVKQMKLMAERKETKLKNTRTIH